jgi:hypothetical protein
MTAFTRPWDDTQPPDTQLANLLGQDIRFLKQDIMQRMGGFGAGLLVDRPTPETTSGSVDFTGVMYWSTDTKQTFRWSGTAWVDITQNVGSGITDYDNYTSHLFVTAAPGVGHTVTIPIGGVQDALLIGSFLEFESCFTVAAFTGTAPLMSIDIGQTVMVASFQVGPGVHIIRATLALSNAHLPVAFATIQSQNGAALNTGTYVGTMPFAIDGSVAITVTDVFTLATTITANASRLHCRVRA